MSTKPIKTGQAVSVILFTALCMLVMYFIAQDSSAGTPEETCSSQYATTSVEYDSCMASILNNWI
jgi:hypothetical protein